MSVDVRRKPGASKEAELEGNDHYARFYRMLQDYMSIEPEKYYSFIRDGVDSIPLPEDIVLFFDALSDYIEMEANKKLKGKTTVKVHIDHSSDFKWQYLIAKMPIKIGERTYNIELINEERFRWGRIAETREAFNEVVERLVNEIVRLAEDVLIRTRGLGS